MNGSTILAGICAAAGLGLAIYAWAPRPAPDSPEAAQFPNERPYAFRYEEITPALRASAEAGDLDAQYELGVKLASVDLNEPPGSPRLLEAAEWLLTAAEAGHPAAANEIGLGYAEGELGLPRDPERAFEWFRRAAAGGDAYGQYHLARAFRDGRGVLRNESAAGGYFILAARQGVPAAQFNLALLAREGVAFKRSRETSRRAASAALRQSYGAGSFFAEELETMSGAKLNDGAAWSRFAPEGAATLRFGLPFDDPAQAIRCRAIFDDVSGIEPQKADEPATAAEKQMALMRVAALLGDPYAQSSLAQYWRARPNEPGAADEEYYWRMRAARNPLKLEIPADCQAKAR